MCPFVLVHKKKKKKSAYIFASNSDSKYFKFSTRNLLKYVGKNKF